MCSQTDLGPEQIRIRPVTLKCGRWRGVKCTISFILFVQNWSKCMLTKLFAGFYCILLFTTTALSFNPFAVALMCGRTVWGSANQTGGLIIHYCEGVCVWHVVKLSAVIFYFRRTNNHMRYKVIFYRKRFSIYTSHTRCLVPVIAACISLVDWFDRKTLTWGANVSH